MEGLTEKDILNVIDQMKGFGSKCDHEYSQSNEGGFTLLICKKCGFGVICNSDDATYFAENGDV